MSDIPKESHVHVHGNDVFSLSKILIKVGRRLRLVPVRLQTHTHAQTPTPTQTRAKSAEGYITQDANIHVLMRTCTCACMRGKGVCDPRTHAKDTHTCNAHDNATTAERGAERRVTSCTYTRTPRAHTQEHQTNCAHTHTREGESDHINELKLVREACVSRAKSRPCRYVFLCCFLGNHSPTSDISDRSLVCPPLPSPSRLHSGCPLLIITLDIINPHPPCAKCTDMNTYTDTDTGTDIDTGTKKHHVSQGAVAPVVKGGDLRAGTALSIELDVGHSKAHKASEERLVHL